MGMYSNFSKTKLKPLKKFLYLSIIMNIKILYFICETFFEILHPNNASASDNEIEDIV